MKKLIISIIILAAIGAGFVSYKITKAKNLNVTNTVQSQNNIVNSNTNTGTYQGSNISSSTTINNENSNNQSSDNIQNTSSINQNNSQSNQVTNKNSILDVSQNFTSSELNTIQDFISSQKIEPGAGSGSLLMNLNYYSVVNGIKYYEVYSNEIPNVNWHMGGIPTPNSNGNYSQLSLKGYISSNGTTISQQQFLDGNLSFNLNNPTNLSNNDIYNMVRKIAIEYKEWLGIGESSQNFDSSLLTNYSSGLTINLNNTKNINGQTYYEVEYVSGEPFYVSLSGDIYLNNVAYLSKVFDMPAMTNAWVQKMMKGM